MQIIIDISEDNYKLIQDGNYCGILSHEIYNAIKNGTILPKGHGRLIILSEDAVKREYTSLGYSCQSWISDVGLSNATVAIIEADKEE